MSTIQWFLVVIVIGTTHCAIVRDGFDDSAVFDEALCVKPANAIIAENCLEGQPSTEWDVNGAGDPNLQGFATKLSVQAKDTLDFKVKTNSSNYRIDIYRLGYYRGLGARLIDTIQPSVELPQAQPECFFEESTRLVDCGEWEISASWSIPANATSGLYFARPTRMDIVDEADKWRADASTFGADPRFAIPGAPPTMPPPSAHSYGASGEHGWPLKNAIREPHASHIWFVVRDDRSHADVVFQTADATWQAYNTYGGSSTYGSQNPAVSLPRSLKVSLNRPMETRKSRAVNAPLGCEYPMIRFLESTGYDVTYKTGLDVHRWGSQVMQHKLFLSTGHDEYWSGPQRTAVEAARDHGVNLAFFSGNEVFWRIRYESSPLPNGEEDRTMVCYKETQSLTKIDPEPKEWTGTFRDGRDINPLGPQPENALTGTIFTVNAWRHDALEVPHAYSKLRFWRNTSVAALQAGQRAILYKVLGHEWDEDVDNGFRPAGLIRMSETHIDNVLYIVDHGSVYDSGSGVHHVVMYRAASGALVLGTGTVQWSWGLDNFHDEATGMPCFLSNLVNTRVGKDQLSPDRDIQQATINAFADMGVQPSGTLPRGVVRASQSTDKTAPTTTIVYPASDAVHVDETLTIRVTATDIQGVVAGVEVSLDGKRWHPTTRNDRRDTVEWTFITSVANGPVTAYARATDDSCNMQADPTQQKFLVKVSDKADQPKTEL